MTGSQASPWVVGKLTYLSIRLLSGETPLKTIAAFFQRFAVFVIKFQSWPVALLDEGLSVSFSGQGII